MDNITIFGYVDEDVQKTVEYLQQKNVGVVIREERDLNVLRFRAAKAKSTGKDREIHACKGKGKENAYPVGSNDNVLSKRTLAQRARREREKITKICSAYQSGQNSTHYAASTPIRHAIMEQGTEMTNTFQRAQDWDEKAMELKRINTTRFLQWKRNKIVVHSPRWSDCIEVDAWIFRKLMKNKFEAMF